MRPLDGRKRPDITPAKGRGVHCLEGCGVKLKAPFPWFGGKSRVADVVWQRFGHVRNYVEPFAGSLAVLLARPNPAGTETVNDLDCYVANFWRAISVDPEGVARAADWPVNEADLHARHQWLVNQVEFRERMKTDPDFFSVKIAGWWVWGISCWIGGGWCTWREKTWQQRPNVSQGVHQKMPRVHPKGGTGVAGKLGRQKRCIPDVLAGRGGRGVLSQQVPDLNPLGYKGSARPNCLMPWFEQLQARLRSVRTVCGDWTRVLGNTPLGLTNNVPPGFKTAVFLDPPYHADLRDAEIYAKDSHDISTAVRQWAIENGDNPRLRIALCGYEDEHAMPGNWSCLAWKANGGYGNRTGNQNAHKERIWFSPHCLQPEHERELFDLMTP